MQTLGNNNTLENNTLPYDIRQILSFLVTNSDMTSLPEHIRGIEVLVIQAISYNWDEEKDIKPIMYELKLSIFGEIVVEIQKFWQREKKRKIMSLLAKDNNCFDLILNIGKYYTNANGDHIAIKWILILKEFLEIISNHLEERRRKNDAN